MVHRIKVPVPSVVSERVRGVPALSERSNRLRGARQAEPTAELASLDQLLLAAVPGQMAPLGDDPEDLLREEFLEADRMRAHVERFAELLAAEGHLEGLRFDPVRVAQICERESLPPVGGPQGTDDAVRGRLFGHLLDGVTVRKTKRSLDHAYRVSLRRLERAERAARRAAAQNSRNPGRRCRGRPPAELPKDARWRDPKEARRDALGIAAALIHLEAHRSLGLAPEQNPLWSLVLEVSCREAVVAAAPVPSSQMPAPKTRQERERVAEQLDAIEREVSDVRTRSAGDTARTLAPAIALMVRKVLRPTLPLEHLLPLVVSEARVRGKGAGRPADDAGAETTEQEAEAAARALEAAFARDEARARRRGDVRRLQGAMLARDALAVLPPAENPFFQAARRAALLDLRASAALGNVPAAVARVLSEPLDSDAQLAYAASLRELGQLERAARVERFVERTFGIEAITGAAIPSGKFNQGSGGLAAAASA